jgi:hypothetical protein
VGKFAPMIARNLRQRWCKPRSRWYFDEMVSRIAGKQMSLWRAVDDEGEVLEVLIRRRRNKAAAGKLIRKLLRKQGFAPTCVMTDKLRSYGAAFQEIGLSDRLFASLSGGQAVAPAGVGKPNSDLSAFKRTFAPAPVLPLADASGRYHPADGRGACPAHCYRGSSAFFSPIPPESPPCF